MIELEADRDFVELSEVRDGKRASPAGNYAWTETGKNKLADAGLWTRGTPLPAVLETVAKVNAEKRERDRVAASTTAADAARQQVYSRRSLIPASAAPAAPKSAVPVAMTPDEVAAEANRRFR